MAKSLTALVVDLVEPTFWQRARHVTYGPLDGPQDPRIDWIIMRAGALPQRATVTLVTLTDPDEALVGFERTSPPKKRKAGSEVRGA